MKEDFLTVNSKEKENLLSLMEIYIQENLKMENTKDTDSLFGQMEIVIKGNISQDKSMATVFLRLIGQNIQVTGKTVFEKDEDFSSKDLSKYLEIGKKTFLYNTDSIVT